MLPIQFDQVGERGLTITGSYPFQDDDPFVITASPHLFVVGSQPRFETKVVAGPNDEVVRLIAVPRFDQSGQVILVDSETLEVERVCISLFGESE